MTNYHFHEEALQESWLDVYGHLNEAYYLVPFTNATWKMQDHFDIGPAYFENTGCALYTVETHLRYLDEVRFPADIKVETMILGSDSKRIWFAHLMMVEDRLRATAEFMTLHYDTRAGKTAAFEEPVQQALKAAEVSEAPDWSSRKISLQR